MNQKIEKFSIMIGFLLSIILLPSIARAAIDTVSINVNVSISAAIEVSPDTATFNLVTPGVDSYPDEQAFTITNIGTVNFTDMYVSVDPTAEASNPLGTGNPNAFEASGFLVLKNQSANATDFKFVGRLEWNLTDKPSDYTKPDSQTNTWGYFGNNSRQYFWDLKSNDTDNTCNQTGVQIRIKNWAVNGTAAAYNLGAEATTHVIDSKQLNWGIFDTSPENAGPLNGYCVAAYYDCTRIFIYQWDQTSPFNQCSDERYLYYDATNKFKPNDQFKFNITVWVPKGIPAGTTNPSTLTVTAE